MAKSARSGGAGLPSAPLNATLIDWGKEILLFRVHKATYAADQFNPSPIGNARFSPLVLPSSTIVPTLYAGTTLDCALMETVFHDVPYAPGLKTLSKKTHIEGQVRSTLRSARNLRLIDLRSIALHKLGLKRSEIIDTDPTEYPTTRQYAVRFHDQVSEGEGMIWTSRQDDQSQAVVLFGDRVSGLKFEKPGNSEPLILPDASASGDVLALATRLGVLIV